MNSKPKNHDKDNLGARDLPERIVSAILVQQDTSERMVGWFQFVVVIILGSVYSISPKTFSTDTTFALVPWFLAVYLLLTSARLVMSYRRRISAPLLYLSVIIDMGLLLGMIWAFHIQYQQPPSFYLKAPTLLYVFVFLSIKQFTVRLQTHGLRVFAYNKESDEYNDHAAGTTQN